MRSTITRKIIIGKLIFLFFSPVGIFEVNKATSQGRGVCISILGTEPCFQIYILFLQKLNFRRKIDLFSNCLAVFLKLLQKCADFVNSDECIGKISSISVRNNPYLFETLTFEPMKMNLNVKTLNLC